MPKTERSRDYPWMIANLDGWLPKENAVLEIKTSMSRKDWGEEDTDNIPTMYLLQCAHYAIVMNASKVYIYASIAGAFPKRFIYNRDEKLEERMIQIEKDFWHNHVLKEIPPTNKIVPQPTKTQVEKKMSTTLKATQEQEDLIKTIIEAKKRCQQEEELIKSVKEQLLETIPDNTTLIDSASQKLVHWTTFKRRSFDSSNFKKQQPDLYEQYMVEKETKRLDISMGDDNNK